MRSVAGVAARVLAVLGFMCGGGTAQAEPAGGSDDPHFLFYSGTDLWRFGAFMHGGVLWSPDGLYHEGFTLKLLMAGGAYRYIAGSDHVTGRATSGRLLPGWRFKQGRSEITVYLGLDTQNHQLSPDDVGNPLRGTHVGLRFAADVWLEPTDMMMVSTAFSLSTIQSSYWTRGQSADAFRRSDGSGPKPTVQRSRLPPVQRRPAAHRASRPPSSNGRSEPAMSSTKIVAPDPTVGSA